MFRRILLGWSVRTKGITVAIIGEQKYGMEPAPHLDWLHNQSFCKSSGFSDRALWREDSYHGCKKDAHLPVPNHQMVVQLVASPGNHAKKVATYLILAIPHQGVLGSFQMKDSPAGRECVTDQLTAHTQVCYTIKLVSICA